MPEVEITKSKVVIVDTVGENQYRDMVFKDKEGNEYKISNKRIQYFKDAIKPDFVVQLDYAMSSFGKEYIFSATPAKDKLPPPVKAPVAQVDIATQKEIKEANKPQFDLRQRSISLSYGVWLAQYGMVPVGFIGTVAYIFERYCSGEIDSDQVDKNLTALLKTTK
jgi:hypothetical protein